MTAGPCALCGIHHGSDYDCAKGVNIDDLDTARVFATEAGRIFLAYADRQPYGAALRADVEARVAKARRWWETKPHVEQPG